LQTHGRTAPKRQPLFNSEIGSPQWAPDSHEKTGQTSPGAALSPHSVRARERGAKRAARAYAPACLLPAPAPAPPQPAGTSSIWEGAAGHSLGGKMVYSVPDTSSRSGPQPWVVGRGLHAGVRCHACHGQALDLLQGARPLDYLERPSWTRFLIQGLYGFDNSNNKKACLQTHALGCHITARSELSTTSSRGLWAVPRDGGIRSCWCGHREAVGPMNQAVVSVWDPLLPSIAAFGAGSELSPRWCFCWGHPQFQLIWQDREIRHASQPRPQVGSSIIPSELSPRCLLLATHPRSQLIWQPALCPKA
jgi:hypothetical protein